MCRVMDMSRNESGTELQFVVMGIKSREKLMRAIGMLEGAAWATNGSISDMLYDIATLVREAIGVQGGGKDDA